MNRESFRRNFTRRTFRGSLTLTFAVFVLIAGIRFVTIFPFSPEHLVHENPPKPVDAILVLEGSPDRIDHGLSLINAGYSSTLIYPGLHAWSRRYLERRTRESESDYTLLSLTNTEGTFDEALNTLLLLRSHPEIESLLLVTSTYHTHRTLWTFQKVLPRSISLASSPVHEDWWTPESAARPGTGANRTFRREQYKFVGYYLLYGWRLFI